MLRDEDRQRNGSESEPSSAISAGMPPADAMITTRPELEAISPDIEPIARKLKQVLHAPFEPIEYVYFVTRGVRWSTNPKTVMSWSLPQSVRRG